MDRGCSSTSGRSSSSRTWVCFASSVRPPHTRDGCQSRNPCRLSTLRDLARLDDAHYLNSTGLDRLASTFFAVDQCQHSGDFSSGTPHRVDCLERGATGGDDILDDRDAVTSIEWTFDQLAGAVLLRLLAHRECPQWLLRSRACVADGIGDWICAQRETAHRIDLPGFVSKSLESDRANQRETIGTHRGEPRVDVQSRRSSGGEGELTAPR